MEIRKIESDDAARFLEFFDNRAFQDNKDWAFCYCNCFYADHCEKKWTERSAAENRSATKVRIKQNKMYGYLALDGEEVVGWCGAGPMNAIPDFDNDDDLEKGVIGVVTCFLVDPNRRREGIARALLREACEDFARLGLRIVEGNPRLYAETPADLHFGPLSLFESEDFIFHREDLDDKSVYVRKEISLMK